MGSCPYCKKHVVYLTLGPHPTDPDGFECPHCGRSIGLTMDGEKIYPEE